MFRGNNVAPDWGSFNIVALQRNGDIHFRVVHIFVAFFVSNMSVTNVSLLVINDTDNKFSLYLFVSLRYGSG